MGKHEAQPAERKSAPKHAAATSTKKKLGLQLPEIKMPKIPKRKDHPKLPKVNLPKREDLPKLPKVKLPKPDWTAVRSFFVKLADYGKKGTASGAEKLEYPFEKEQILLTAGSVVLFFILWLLPTSGWLRYFLYFLPLLVLGAQVFQDAVGELLDRRWFGRHVLICIAALGLLFLKQSHTAVFVLLIHRVLLLLESYLSGKKDAMREKLHEILPRTAVVVEEEGLQSRDAKAVEVDDILFVAVGETIPLDGVVEDGISTLNVSALSGSETGVDVGVNSPVCAGSVNLTNPIKVRVTRPYHESKLSRMVKRVCEAAETEPVRASLLQKILNYLPLALAVSGVLLALIASIVSGKWGVWIYRGLLLIALGGCGDALLSSRMAFFTGMFDACRERILYKDADVVDRLAGSDLMIFSKTGTITEGKYKLTGVFPVGYEEKDLLTIAAMAECQSQHPIAKALREACGIEAHHRSDITLLEETPGRGIHALFGGRNVYVGNSTLLLDHNIVFEVPSHKGTVIHVAVDNKYAGCIVFSDRVRDNAFDAIEELRMRGIRATVMLTGDVRSMARPIASSLSFDMVKYELSNESKLEALEYLRNNKGNAAAISYVSSKAEDLDLLAQADVGIAFSVMTEAEPMDPASVVIMGNDLNLIPQAMFMAKRIMIAGLIDAAVMLGLLLLLIVLGVTGAMSIWLAMLLVLVARFGTLVYSIYFK